MATILGFDKTIYKKFTCYNCGAIVQYTPNEVKLNGQTDEDTKIVGLFCPNCDIWHRTNP